MEIAPPNLHKTCDRSWMMVDKSAMSVLKSAILVATVLKEMRSLM
ncbi:hypothetical protein [Nostoc sp.]